MIETIGADPQDQAPPRPEGERRLTAGGCLIQVAGFIPPAIAAFVLTMMAFARYNPWPRDEMTQALWVFGDWSSRFLQRSSRVASARCWPGIGPIDGRSELMRTRVMGMRPRKGR